MKTRANAARKTHPANTDRFESVRKLINQLAIERRKATPEESRFIEAALSAAEKELAATRIASSKGLSGISAGGTLVACSSSVTMPGIPAAEACEGAWGRSNCDASNVLERLACYHRDSTAPHCVVISAVHLDARDRQRAAARIGHLFPARSDGVETVDGICWVPLAHSTPRAEVAEVVKAEFEKAKRLEASSWTIALFPAEAFKFKSYAEAAAFLSSTLLAMEIVGPCEREP